MDIKKRGMDTKPRYVHATYIGWYLRTCCARMNENRTFRREKIQFVIALDLIKCLKQIKYRIYSLRAYLFFEFPSNICTKGTITDRNVTKCPRCVVPKKPLLNTKCSWSWIKYIGRGKKKPKKILSLTPWGVSQQ